MLLHVYFKKRNYTFETLPLTLSWPFNLVSSNLCPALPRPATRWHMSLMIRGPSRHTSEQCSCSREKKEKERLHPWEMRRCLLDAINTSGWDRRLLPASVIFLAVQTEWVRIKSQAFSDEDIVAFFPLNMYLGIFLFLTFPLWVVYIKQNGPSAQFDLRLFYHSSTWPGHIFPEIKIVNVKHNIIFYIYKFFSYLFNHLRYEVYSTHTVVTLKL